MLLFNYLYFNQSTCTTTRSMRYRSTEISSITERIGVLLVGNFCWKLSALRYINNLCHETAVTPPPQTQWLNTSVSVSHTKHCVWMSFATVLTFFQVLLLFYISLCSYFIVLFIVYDTYVLPFDVINNNNNNKLCAWQHNTPRPSPPPVGAQAPRRPAEQTQRSSTFPPVGFPRRIRSHADRCNRLTR